MAIWDDVIPEQDRRVYEAAGLGVDGGYGERPVLLVVDVIYNFIGEKPQPILDAVEQSRFSTGERGWEALGHLKTLIDAARAKQVPVFYTGSERRPDGFDQGGWNRKAARANEAVDVVGAKGNQVPEEIAMQPSDVWVQKRKPSAFFGSDLIAHLVYLNADTVIVTGATTSGCVRATAVDAASYNYRTVMPEECVWDRSELSHKVNLFDFHMKYGDVKPLADVLDYLASLPQQPCGPDSPTGIASAPAPA